MNVTRRDLTERYATFSTGRLLEMLDKREEYTADAIDVLQAELAKRQVGTQDAQQYVAAREIEHAEERRKASLTLTFWEKAFFYFVWFVPGFIVIAIGMNYITDGYNTKLYQSRFYRISGFSFLLLTGLLSTLVGFGEVIGIALLIVFFGITYWAEGKIKPHHSKSNLDY